MAHSNGYNGWSNGGSHGGRGGGQNGRSRSPPGPPNGTSIFDSSTPLAKGSSLQFFHEGNPADKGALLVQPSGSKQHTGRGPVLLLSHGWFDGTLHEEFNPTKYDEKVKSTWPVVMPANNVHFVDKTGWGKKGGAKPQPVRLVRHAANQPPALSIMLVRWSGPHAPWMDDDEPNDGDWGKYGSPASDEYMDALCRMGVLAHPKIADDEGLQCNAQIFQLYVSSSADMWEVQQMAPWLQSQMKGRKRTVFWMLWPAEWEDTGDPDFACYIERHAMFNAMRTLEGVGLQTGFPHPADQYELITSKTWMATLSVVPAACLPAGVMVSKGSAVRDLKLASEQALAGLHYIKRMNPYSVGPDEPPAPSVINKDGIKKGVVKLGWSWENRFVLTFNDATQLQARLKELLNVQGCTAQAALVQEWVDFDFEMRYYFLPPADWLPSGETVLEPTRFECNEWGERDEKGSAGTSRASFSKLSEEGVLKKWQGDKEAWDDARMKATKISQFCLSWLISANASPFPMIRLDFMMKRIGPGKARVYFGEYCEMGACCLGWVEGPPTIWRAAIDAAMR